jgi:hypothetical protein
VWLFGSWVDGKMAEYKDGKQVNRLADLLDLKPSPRKLNKAALMSRVGSRARVVNKKM